VELPIQITYREIDPSDALSKLIRVEAAKLDRFFDRIVSCRVLVEREPRHLRAGAPYHVRIDIGVPGEELVIKAAPTPRAVVYKDPALAIRDAFRRARRRVHDHARRVTERHLRA
jgi:ribosome-associated translation inhibitor RaiA